MAANCVRKVIYRRGEKKQRNVKQGVVLRLLGPKDASEQTSAAYAFHTAVPSDAFHSSAWASHSEAADSASAKPSPRSCANVSVGYMGRTALTGIRSEPHRIACCVRYKRAFELFFLVYRAETAIEMGEVLKRGARGRKRSYISSNATCIIPARLISQMYTDILLTRHASEASPATVDKETVSPGRQSGNRGHALARVHYLLVSPCQ